MKSALEDVKVVEYGNFISGPFCGKLLADLGAEVIKIEQPEKGDISRRRGPFLNDVPDHEGSGLFLYLNTNKLGVTLNVEKSTGKAIFEKLIKEADILIEDTKPGRMDQLGIGPNKLKSINPRLVITSVTSFGQTGPYKDYNGSDLIGWHMGGAGYLTPRRAVEAEQEPLRVMEMASFLTGIGAAAATMCALHVQRHTGRGQQTDVSQLEIMVGSLGYFATSYPYENTSATRVSRGVFAPYHFVRCKDGWVFLNAALDRFWERLVDAMGNPEWANLEFYQDMWLRGEYWESLEPLISEWLMQHTKAEIFEIAKNRMIPIAPVNTVEELMQNRQLEDRKFFINLDPQKAALCPGAPYKFLETPWKIRRPAPRLGEHNKEIYHERLGIPEKELVKMYETGII